jgi:transposase
MSKVLSNETIRERMVEWRNLKKLHKADRQRIVILEYQLKEVRSENKELRSLVGEVLEQNQKLSIRVEELQIKVFGKKKNKDDNNDDTPPKKLLRLRSTDSYKRPIPKKEDITKTKYYKLSKCSCGQKLQRKRIKEYYEEDIVLPRKKVTHHKVEQGYCNCCRGWQSAKSLPSAKVILGSTIQNYTCYSNTVLRLTYSQIQEHLNEVFQLFISEGEITKILERKAISHKEDYTKLKAKIQGESVIHMDETTTKIRDGDGYTAYTWLMQGKESDEVLFDIGKTRGGGNATHLLGDSLAVGVTDDYGVYKNIFSNHQLCWAHLHRKLRDLATSSVLDEKIHSHCREIYEKESEIYSEVRRLSNRDDLSDKQRTFWITKLSKELEILAEPHKLDPHKLQTYKQTLSRNIYKYLTCIRLPNVPCDNNQAERSLRHVVLKRKISFGHISKKGAETTSILMSIFMTIKNRIKGTNQGFFETYANFAV